MPLRLKLLVVAHVLLSIAGIAQFRVLLDMLWLPAATTISSLAIAQSMLLGFWIGLGTSRPWQRCLGWITSSLYLGIWPALAVRWLPADSIIDDTSFENGFVPAATMFAGTTAVFAAIFLLIRWRFAALQYAPNASARSGPPQFAIIHLLVATTALSLLMASLRGAVTTALSSPWHTVALYALLLTTFVMIVVAVPWAVLQPGRVWRRTLIVLVCSLAAGAVVSFVFYSQLQAVQAWHWWWLFVGQSMALGLAPTLILTASLAVVRWCGYRLVSKRSALAAEPLQFNSAPLNSRIANEA